MPALAQFRFTGGWKKYARKLGGPGQMAVRKAADRVVRTNALLLVAEIRRRITAGKYAANAQLTQLIKGSSKPLVDRGQLFQSITSVRLKEATYFVGVLRMAKTFNVSLIVHEGATITVTAKMEAMFQTIALAVDGKIPVNALKSARAIELYKRLKKNGKGFSVLKAGTILRIPARPFIHEPFGDPKVRALLRANWSRGISAALRAVT